MRDSENISSLLSLKLDFIGFIFYEKSKRFVTEFPKVEIPSAIKKVGVFVNEKPDEILKKVNDYQLDYVQLHGNETPEYCQNLQRSKLVSASHNVGIIKAFSLGDEFDFGKTIPYQDCCDYLLFDTKGKDYGGTGLKFNWELLKKYKGNTPYFLSGGIGLEDTNRLTSFSRTSEANLCVAVDVNSRFETKQGIKNIEKLNEFKFNLL